MRRLIAWLGRLWRGTGNADVIMNHVPVARDQKRRDWRRKALKSAAVKHGKPFKTAAQHLPHEVLTRGTEPKAQDNVRALPKRSSAK